MITRPGRAPLAHRLGQVVETQASIARAGLRAGAVLRLVLAQAKELTGAAGVAIVVDEGGRFAVASAAGSAAALAATSHPLLDAMTARVLASAQAAVWREVDPELGGGLAVASAVAVPIHDGERRSALVALAPAPAAFGPEDVQVLQLLAGLAAAAIGAGAPTTGEPAEADRLAHLSTHDAVTLLPNRALFGDRLQHALALARRHHTRLCVMALEVAGFTELNERLRRTAADELLRGVAARLRGAVREADTVARLGGDEFVLLLTGDVAPDAVSLLEDRLRAALERGVDVGGERLELRASIGAACYPDDGEDAEALLRRAEAALLG